MMANALSYYGKTIGETNHMTSSNLLPMTNSLEYVRSFYVRFYSRLPVSHTNELSIWFMSLAS